MFNFFAVSFIYNSNNNIKTNVEMKDIEYKKHGYGEVYNETISIPEDMVFIECDPENTEYGHYDGYHHYIGFSKDRSWVDNYELEEENEDTVTYNTGIHYEVLCDVVVIVLNNIQPITPLKVLTFEEIDKTFNISDLYFVKSSKGGNSDSVFHGIYHIKSIIGTAGVVADAVVRHNKGFTIENNTFLNIGQIVNNERSDVLISMFKGKEFSYVPSTFYEAVNIVTDGVLNGSDVDETINCLTMCVMGLLLIDRVIMD